MGADSLRVDKIIGSKASVNSEVRSVYSIWVRQYGRIATKPQGDSKKMECPVRGHRRRDIIKTPERGLSWIVDQLRAQVP